MICVYFSAVNCNDLNILYTVNAHSVCFLLPQSDTCVQRCVKVVTQQRRLTCYSKTIHYLFPVKTNSLLTVMLLLNLHTEMHHITALQRNVVWLQRYTYTLLYQSELQCCQSLTPKLEFCPFLYETYIVFSIAGTAFKVFRPYWKHVCNGVGNSQVL